MKHGKLVRIGDSASPGFGLRSIKKGKAKRRLMRWEAQRCRVYQKPQAVQLLNEGRPAKTQRRVEGDTENRINGFTTSAYGRYYPRFLGVFPLPRRAQNLLFFFCSNCDWSQSHRRLAHLICSTNPDSKARQHKRCRIHANIPTPGINLVLLLVAHWPSQI